MARIKGRPGFYSFSFFQEHAVQRDWFDRMRWAVPTRDRLAHLLLPINAFGTYESLAFRRPWLNSTFSHEEVVARILQIRDIFDDPESMVAAARGGHDTVLELLLALGGPTGPCASSIHTN